MSVTHTKTFDEDIRNAFDRMKIVDPVDGLEFLPPKFIAPALHDLGLNPTNTEVQEILGITDTKQEGRITYDTFCSFARQMSDTHLDDNLLNKCFSIFDTNHDGVLSRDEFRVALQHNGEGLTDEELDLAMKIADADGNGVINYPEFVAYMTQNDHLNAEMRERVMSFRAQQSANFSNSPIGLTGSPSLRHASMRGASMVRDGSMRQTASPKRSGDLSLSDVVSQRLEEPEQTSAAKLEDLTNEVQNEKQSTVVTVASKVADSNATTRDVNTSATNNSTTAASVSGDKSVSKSATARKPERDAKARQCCTIS